MAKHGEISGSTLRWNDDFGGHAETQFKVLTCCNFAQTMEGKEVHSPDCPYVEALAKVEKLTKLSQCEHGTPWDIDCPKCDQANDKLGEMIHKYGNSDKKKVDAIRKVLDELHSCIEACDLIADIIAK